MPDLNADSRRYFERQVAHATKHIMPFINKIAPIRDSTHVLEIGCGEGGTLKAFANAGCSCVGAGLDGHSAANAHKWLEEEIAAGKICLITENMTKTQMRRHTGQRFDIILYKDILAQAHCQSLLTTSLERLLRPGGVIFFAFPSRPAPFDKYRQPGRSRILCKLPPSCQLPMFHFRELLLKTGEPAEHLIEIREKKIGVTTPGSKIGDTRSVYEWTFGRWPEEDLPQLRMIPSFCNYFTTCAYYLVRPVITG